jgi:hypothetical protein
MCACVCVCVFFFKRNLFSMLHYIVTLHALQLNINNIFSYGYQLCVFLQLAFLCVCVRVCVCVCVLHLMSLFNPGMFGPDLTNTTLK